MSQQQSEADAAGIDSHASMVSGPRRLQLTGGQKAGVAGLVALVFIAFIWIDFSLHRKNAENTPSVKAAPAQAIFRQAPITLPPLAEPSVQQARPPQGKHEMSAAESPIFAFSGGGSGDGQRLMTGQRPIVPSLTQAGADGPDSIGSRLKPTTIEGAKAGLLPHPDMLITKGTIIPCTLQTAINTQLAGFVKCVLPEAVRSTTGNVVLLDRGTIVVGEIQSGLVQGQERVFILWDRAETPGHAVVSLASPGADELGRSGVPGEVNNHFWQRFGSAIMLSVVQGSLQAGAARAGSPASGGVVNNVQSSSNDLANSALQASIHIPPTLEKNQGDNVSIFVARDIDFSDVYSLDLNQ